MRRHTESDRRNVAPDVCFEATEQRRLYTDGDGVCANIAADGTAGWLSHPSLADAMATHLVIYFSSAFLAVLITPAVIRLAHRIRAVDRPGVRAVHKSPIPRIGGVAIFLSAICPLVAALLVSDSVDHAFGEMRSETIVLLCAVTFIFLVGLVDDLKSLPARFKFLAEILAGVVLCLAGIRIERIALTNDWVLVLNEWGCVLTVLWVVGITNAVNLSDGLDGLAAGISAIACGTIAVFAVHSGDAAMCIFMLALLGSLSGFLLFNFNPAKVFMGDCGSLFLGFTIASASVLCVAKSAALVGLALPALALGIPIFDTLFAMLRRFLERRSLFAPDRSHFHHRLLDLGLHQRQAVMTIYLATLVAAGLGLFMMVNQSLRSLVVFGCVLLLIVLLFRVVNAVRLRETMTRLRERYAVSQQQKQDRQVFEHLQLCFRQVTDPANWWQTVCETAQRMGFTQVSLKTMYSDGRLEEKLWRSPEEHPMPPGLITMTIPCGDGHLIISRQFEIAICVRGSLEAAARRASLFGRLMDEHAPATGLTCNCMPVEENA